MTAALVAFLLRHETLVGWAAVLVGAALLGGLAVHRLDAPSVAKARAAVATAQSEAAAAAASTRMATAASAAVETARGRETAAAATTQETVDALAKAPQADQPVPPDVLRGWASGVDGLRDQAAAARAPTGDPGGAGPARPVPPA